MHHLDEVPGAGRSAEEVAEFRGRVVALAMGRDRNVALAGSEGGKERLELFEDLGRRADHETVAAFESPDAAAGADVHVVDAFGQQHLGTADIIGVFGVAAVDYGVAGFHAGGEFGDGGFGNLAGGQHHPDGARLGQLRHEFVQGGAAGGAFLYEAVNGGGGTVVDDTGVSCLHETAYHVAAHAAKSDHSKLHSCWLCSPFRISQSLDRMRVRSLRSHSSRFLHLDAKARDTRALSRRPLGGGPAHKRPLYRRLLILARVHALRHRAPPNRRQ